MTPPWDAHRAAVTQHAATILAGLVAGDRGYRDDLADPMRARSLRAYAIQQAVMLEHETAATIAALSEGPPDDRSTR